MAYFSVDVLTPEKVLGKNLEADSLLIPTAAGQINVLPEHTHILSKLDTGVFTIKTKEGKERHFSMTTGSCKVLGKKVTVLATVSERAEDINEARAQKALTKSQEVLRSSKSEDELLKYNRKLARAQVRIQLCRLLLNK